MVKSKKRKKDEPEVDSNYEFTAELEMDDWMASIRVYGD